MMPAPRRDPTARDALANVLQDEARQHGLTLRQYLTRLMDEDATLDDPDAEALRVRRRFATP